MKKKSLGKKKTAKKSLAKKTAARKTAKTKAAKRTAKKAFAKSVSKDFARTAPKKAKATRATKAAAKTAAKKSSPSMESQILKTGQVAPDFNLPTDAGTNVSLKDFAGKTVVLYFYPKDDTPGCTQESCDFRDSFTRVQAKGAIVLGVSKDSIESHQKFKQKFSLPFPLVSDESGKMLQAYEVWQEKVNYGKKYMGIVRTTYLIDVDANGKGTIRKAYPKVKVEGHVDEILKDLG